MANYAVYSDVEKAKFGTTGKTFTSPQQSTVTSLITKAHGVIVGYLGTEPSVTEGLKQVEVELVLRMLWNVEHPQEKPMIILVDEYKALLDLEASDDTAGALISNMSYYRNID